MDGIDLVFHFYCFFVCVSKSTIQKHLSMQNGHLFAPVNFLEGVQSNLDDIFNKSSFFRLDSLSDYSIALQRLRKVPAAIDGVVDTLKKGVEEDVTYAK